jgi:hypothetical protein
MQDRLPAGDDSAGLAVFGRKPLQWTAARQKTTVLCHD